MVEDLDVRGNPEQVPHAEDEMRSELPVPDNLLEHCAGVGEPQLACEFGVASHLELFHNPQQHLTVDVDITQELRRKLLVLLQGYSPPPVYPILAPE